ncbi:MAG: hypothetical protein Fur0014_14860 [Rubrivivax sp.]
MSPYPLPIVIPLARPWPQRLREAVLGAWQDWAGWRARERAARQVCRLSARTLDDVGAPAEWHAAAAHCRAREAMERRLLRLGVVPGAPW